MRKESKITLADGSIATVVDNNNTKVLKSPKYNFFFNRSNGMFVRWGKSEIELPTNYKVSSFEVKLFNIWSSVFGKDVAGDIRTFIQNLQDDGDPRVGQPEILDLEISEVCNGVKATGDTIATPCRFCYKSNTGVGDNMTLETFKNVVDKMGASLTQIALGIGNIDGNPDMWDMCEYSRSLGIVPNITINGDRMTPEIYDKCAKYFGAMAISYYDKDLCFNSIKELTDRGMKQINIHYMIAEETYETAMNLLDDLKTDERASKLNALVFLSLKRKGNAIKGKGFHQLSQEKFTSLVEKADELGISLGFDTCSAFKCLDAHKTKSNFESIKQCIETCESTQYSVYINCKGNFYPCSFSEKSISHKYPELDWSDNGLSVVDAKSFKNDIWEHPRTIAFRNKNIECARNCESCSMYDI